MPSEIIIDDEEKYYVSSVKINLKRSTKSIQQIVGSFYLSTGIFAALSLISFMINIDAVPGRMGLLITLYLIQSFLDIVTPSVSRQKVTISRNVTILNYILNKLKITYKAMKIMTTSL